MGIFGRIFSGDRARGGAVGTPAPVDAPAASVELQTPAEVQQILERGFNGMNLEQIKASLERISKVAPDFAFVKKSDDGKISGRFSISRALETLFTIIETTSRLYNNLIPAKNVKLSLEFLSNKCSSFPGLHGLKESIKQAVVDVFVSHSHPLDEQVGDALGIKVEI